MAAKRQPRSALDPATATRRPRPRLRAVASGEHIDGFTVGACLHEGGMARLYRISHPHHRGPLVMKVPRLEPEAPLSALVAFENEMRILARLKGPHVPRLVATGDLRTTPYLVMEYVEGDALARAAASAPVEIGRLRDLGRRLALAVHELHRQDVIHLDLNPRNVRDRPETGEMVLVDFGMAHHAALPDLLDTAFGEQEGTTAYIAPEQLEQVRHESRSDIYALGVILYQLATGHYPYGRPNLLSLKKRLLRPPPPPRLHNPALPPWLQEVILRCLEIRPEDRYSTAKEVAYALAHPESVPLTRRAHATRDVPWPVRVRLWWRSLYQVFDEGEVLRPYERVRGAPHVVVALDLAHTSDTLAEALANAVRKFANAERHSYFTFLHVLPHEPVAAAQPEVGAAQRLAELRHFADRLGLKPGRVFFQVMEGEPAAAILDYARTHVVDYIILGARASSALRRYLGSVSARVVAEAPCSVIVVRSRREPLPLERTDEKLLSP
jgi:nucleotide-binding universal stress UspA family protein